MSPRSRARTTRATQATHATRAMHAARATIALLLTGACGHALAHVGGGDVAGGFAAGFLHPLLGLDHVAAMVAVGIWGAQLGAPAIWMLPITFPLLMAVGGAIGALGFEVGGIEIGIAASAIVLGAMIAFAVRLPLAVATALVAVFALCHGYAHGAELPASASAIAYASGFVVTTGALHATGIGFGTIERWRRGAHLLRVAGVVIAVVGVWFLLPHLGG
ncbi:MAG: HupE/UreJ family protein [Lautropia sp.]